MSIRLSLPSPSPRATARHSIGLPYYSLARSLAHMVTHLGCHLEVQKRLPQLDRHVVRHCRYMVERWIQAVVVGGYGPLLVCSRAQPTPIHLPTPPTNVRPLHQKERGVLREVEGDGRRVRGVQHSERPQEGGHLRWLGVNG